MKRINDESIKNLLLEHEKQVKIIFSQFDVSKIKIPTLFLLRVDKSLNN